jgi:hypothetical protein
MFTNTMQTLEGLKTAAATRESLSVTMRRKALLPSEIRQERAKATELETDVEQRRKGIEHFGGAHPVGTPESHLDITAATRAGGERRELVRGQELQAPELAAEATVAGSEADIQQNRLRRDTTRTLSQLERRFGITETTTLAGVEAAHEQTEKSKGNRELLKTLREGGFYERKANMTERLLALEERNMLSTIKLREAQALAAGDTASATSMKQIRQMLTDQFLVDNGWNPVGLDAISLLSKAGAITDRQFIETQKNTIKRAIARLEAGVPIEEVIEGDLNPQWAALFGLRGAVGDIEKAKKILNDALEALDTDLRNLLDLGLLPQVPHIDAAGPPPEQVPLPETPQTGKLTPSPEAGSVLTPEQRQKLIEGGRSRRER